MAKDKIPGLSIALVDREGILWAAGFGRTGHWGRPVTPDTLFSIGSTSKTFTATGVMIAVQDGLLDLDTPIAEYLPDFTVNNRFEERPQDKITLRHLLTHTAGVAHDTLFGSDLADVRYGSLEEHVLSIEQTWLKSRVGERFSYSNPGIDLAAYIFQVQSGRSFEQYMKEKVLDPLGMPNSSLDYGFVEDHPNRARGHTPGVSESPPIPMVGAGGVYTTARDLSRFMRFHLNRGTLDGQTILEPRFVDAMYTKITDAILDRLITQKVATKDTSGAVPTADELIGKDTRLSGLPEAGVVHTPTPFRPEWKRYVRTYRIRRDGYKLHPVVWIGLVLGGCIDNIKVTVEEKDGLLWVKSVDSQGEAEPLEEHEPGLFFTPAGEALDFRGPGPTWRNLKMDAPWLLWSI